jgi:coenzyme F420-0:L-glutamate ligase/coenzyme F420-1:gamma-L-glutamate ligase
VSLEIMPVDGIGEVRSGTDLATLVIAFADIKDGDVVVITSKVVSKALGLASTRTREEVIVEQTEREVARRGETAIVRTRHGLTLAAAGVDASNVTPGVVLPLPDAPDAVAREIRSAIRLRADRTVAVVISDTAGRAWRVGQTDIAIGCAGLAPFDSYVGRADDYGNELFVTAPAVADEVAGAAELAAGKVAGRPITIVRGLEPRLLLDDDGPGATALIRSEREDMFGLGAREAVLASLGGRTVRGFAEFDGPLPDLIGLAQPGGLHVDTTPDGFVIRAHPDQLIEAGMLKQRLLSVAVAHDFRCRVDVNVE